MSDFTCEAVRTPIEMYYPSIRRHAFQGDMRRAERFVAHRKAEFGSSGVLICFLNAVNNARSSTFLHLERQAHCAQNGGSFVGD